MRKGVINPFSENQNVEKKKSFILYPTSFIRLFIDFISIILISYDIIEVFENYLDSFIDML